MDINKLPDGWFNPQDVETYRKLVSQVKKGGIMYELGSWKGRSACSISDILIEKQIKIWLVDTFEGTTSEGEAHAEAKEGKLERELITNLTSHGLSDLAVIRKGRTDDSKVLAETEGKEIDFLFLDADHMTHAVMMDIYNWLPKMAQHGVIAGHDYSWDTVRNALKRLGIFKFVQVEGNMWWINVNSLRKIIMSQTSYSSDVTAVICTRDRMFTTLPLTLMAVINQEFKPDFITIYDDSTKKWNPQTEPMYINMVKLMEHYGISYHFQKTDNVGQVKNHQHALENCKTTYIWRVDDDVIPEPCNLLNLVAEIKSSGAAAVGGLIPTFGFNGDLTNMCSSKLEDIDSKPNLQFAINSGDLNPITENVEHLHCSFLFNAKIPNAYETRLSRVGHREETLFSYGFVKAGHKLGIVRNTSSFHLKEPMGGIRDGKKEMFEHDEAIYQQIINGREVILPTMPHNIHIQSPISVNYGHAEAREREQESVYKLKNRTLVYLDCAVGDHWAFKNAGFNLDSEDIVVSCCFPEVFEGLKCKIISIEDGKTLINNNEKLFPLGIETFQVYKFMWDNKWEKKGKTLVEAFKVMYELHSDIPVL